MKTTENSHHITTYMSLSLTKNTNFFQLFITHKIISSELSPLNTAWDMISNDWMYYQPNVASNTLYVNSRAKSVHR